MTHATTQQALTITRSVALMCAIMLYTFVAGCQTSQHLSSSDESSNPQTNTFLHRYARICMGSRCTIVIEAESEREAARVAAAGFEEIGRIEQVLSDYRSESESMRVMRKEPNRWHPVSETLFRVLSLSEDIHNRTGGAFDPTMGAFTHLWRQSEHPSHSMLSQASGRAGFSHLSLDHRSGSIRFDTEGMILDFGGIGKGFAAQHALDLIQGMGYGTVSIDLGGDLALGEPPSHSPDGWRVEIQTGISETRIEYLANCAVATSGDLERFYEFEGVRYSHIIDPATGLGITQRRAATVIASDAAVADALASAVCVLGGKWRESIPREYPRVRVELISLPIHQ